MFGRNSAITILVIRGIRIRVDASWLIPLTMFVWLSYNRYTSVYPEWTTAQQLAVAVAAVLLLFLSVLLHELAHSLMAQFRGIKVRDITLFLLGGVSNIQTESDKPFDEFMIAIVGPLTNVVLFFALWGVAATNWVTNPYAAELLGYLQLVNVVLAIFNMIPGFPLDGGRVLRTLIWLVTKQRNRSALWATTVGQGVGGLFVAAAAAVLVLSLLNIGLNFANAFNALWIMLLGVFITLSASTYKRHVRALIQQEELYRYWKDDRYGRP